MLSLEQERVRALKVSQLYGQKFIKPRPVDIKPLNLSPAIISGLVMTIPIVAFATLLNIYRNTSYWNLSDVQGASMIFIPGLMAVFFCAVLAVRYIYEKLYNSYAFSTAVFRVGVGLVIGISFSFFELTTGSGMQSPFEIMARIAIFTVGIGLASVATFTALVRVFYNRDNKY